MSAPANGYGHGGTTGGYYPQYQYVTYPQYVYPIVDVEGIKALLERIATALETLAQVRV